MRPAVPKSKRNITIFFMGKCMPYRGKNVGKKMRFAIVSPQLSAIHTDIFLTIPPSTACANTFTCFMPEKQMAS